jgi:hypothetical protein
MNSKRHKGVNKKKSRKILLQLQSCIVRLEAEVAQGRTGTNRR